MILGLFTQIGINKTIEARDNEGFDIFVEKFGVSTTAGALDDSRTTPNTEFYNGPVSGRIKINQNTIQVLCTVPQGQALSNQNIREVYLYGKDSSNNDFLLAFGQPQNQVDGIVYDPDGSVTMKIQISLVNVNLTALYQFTNTIAVELDDHNNDPNAHLEYVKEMRHAGIKVDTGPFNDDYEGALYDKRAEFDGDYAEGTTTGVVVNFRSTYRGTEGNSISLVFDGVKTVDQIRQAWNVANPDNTIEHDGAGTEVPPAQTLNLTGGSYNVSQLDLVYKASDGLYKKALAGGVGAQAKPFGFAYLGERTVKPLGLHKYTHSFTIGANVYLSDVTAGAITTTPTKVKVGYVHGINTIALNLGVPSEGADDEYDAVVTDIAGVKNFPTTQQAINFINPSGGRILVNKLEELTATLDCMGKRIDFFFAGKKTGWKRYAGTNEQHLITFSSVPTSGTWRIVYSVSQETIDLAYNANAAAIQAAINAVFPLNPCTVTGNYLIGFTITHANLADIPNPYFTDLGQNEIQQISCSNTPDNGSAAFVFNGQTTSALAWNDNAAQLESYLEALSNLTDVLVTGAFPTFQVEFTGVDGLKPQPQMTVALVPPNTLALGVSPTNITITTLQQGEYPANALLNGVNPVTITANIVVEGSAIGSTKAIMVDVPYTTFRGLGIIQNFTDGIDLDGSANCDIEMVFDNVTNPVLNTGLVPNRDYHIRNSFGLSEKRELLVGAVGDYKTLALAYAAANLGDKIIVTEDQVITSALVLNKEVEIEFLHNAKINVNSNIAGAVLTLGGKLRTRNLVLFINHSSVFTTGIYITSQQGHHENLGFEISTGATITNAILIDSGCTKMFADGYLTLNAATVTNKLLDNASVKNNNYNFRDVNGLILPSVGSLFGYDAVVGTSAQVAAGQATHSTVQAAHDAVPAGGSILVLQNPVYAGNITISKTVSITGQGYGTQLNGTVTLTATAIRCLINNLRFLQNVTLASGAIGNIIMPIWRASGVVITDNNTFGQNLHLGFGE